MFFLGYLFFYSVLATLINTSIFFSILSFVLGGMLYFNSSSPLQGIAICAFELLHLISRLCYLVKECVLVVIHILIIIQVIILFQFL